MEQKPLQLTDNGSELDEVNAFKLRHLTMYGNGADAAKAVAMSASLSSVASGEVSEAAELDSFDESGTSAASSNTATIEMDAASLCERMEGRYGLNCGPMHRDA